jgi:hypothetical protein
MNEMMHQAIGYHSLMRNGMTVTSLAYKSGGYLCSKFAGEVMKPTQKKIKEFVKVFEDATLNTFFYSFGFREVLEVVDFYMQDKKQLMQAKIVNLFANTEYSLGIHEQLRPYEVAQKLLPKVLFKEYEVSPSFLDTWSVIKHVAIVGSYIALEVVAQTAIKGVMDLRELVTKVAIDTASLAYIAVNAGSNIASTFADKQSSVANILQANGVEVASNEKLDAALSKAYESMKGTECHQSYFDGLMSSISSMFKFGDYVVSDACATEQNAQRLFEVLQDELHKDDSTSVEQKSLEL